MAEEAKEMIIEVNKTMVRFFQEQNWKGMSELYTPDCHFMPEGVPVGIGRQAVAEMSEAVHSKGISQIALDTAEVDYVNHNVAIERGVVKMLNADGNLVSNGKYLVVWKKMEGKWYLHKDIFNSDSCKLSLEDEIAQANNKWMGYYRSKDFKSLSHIYTPDCKLMPPGMDIKEGRLATEKTFESVYKSGIESIELKTIEFEPLGDTTVMDRGTFHMFDKANIQVQYGKYVVIWKKMDDGSYRMKYDCFNTDH